MAMADGRKHNLELFTTAKKEAGEIFGDLLAAIRAAQQIFGDKIIFTEVLDPVVHSSCTVGTDEQQKALAALSEKAALIKSSASRDFMKVVFIGRTSNGKSTTINAMVHARVLPSGSGHTTSCFCEIKGTSKEDPYLLAPTSPNPRPISDVDQLADALAGAERLSCDAIVELHWPINKCHLLMHDVVFIDSPGLDISHDSDSWIDKHCTDADVFVLVSNFESSLSRTEISFFERVVAKLSKPNIFVLFNRWDMHDEEEARGRDVIGQHMDSARDFLVRELKLHTEDLLRDRVFFVSSKETLQRRSGRSPNPSEAMNVRYEYVLH
jgi:hypothetical protein